jgi:type IV pilus assembly protein PilV
MKLKRNQQGIMLLEAMIAVILLGIGLIGAILIQARSFGALSDATMRAEATMASESLVALMTNDRANLAAYALAAGGTPGAALAPWVAETQRVIPGATLVVEVVPTATTTHSRVNITIGWQRKATDPLNTHLITAHLAGAQ